MPVTVRFLDGTKKMDIKSTVNWLKAGGEDIKKSKDLYDSIPLFLSTFNHVYGFLEQRRFKTDLSSFSILRKKANTPRKATAHDLHRELASILRGIMLTCAVKQKIEYKPWNQYLVGHQKDYEQWLGRGLCQGLSVKFLDCCKKGEDFLKLMSGDKLKVKQYEYTKLQKEIGDAAVAGNTPPYSTKKDLYTLMKSKYGFTHVETVTYGSTSSFYSHSRCGAYVGANGYYLISTTGHCMALFRKTGSSIFLEPNAGVVSCGSPSQMQSFFSDYFGNNDVRGFYGTKSSAKDGPKGKVVLTVEKFRR